MKKAILLGLLALLFQTVNAQKLDSSVLKSPQRLHDYYWNKRDNKNTTGWVLLGTGVAAIGIGILIQENVPGGDYASGTAVGLAAGGFALTLTSIPFFVSATINKRKARLALKKEKIALGNNPWLNSSYAAVAIKIAF